MDIPRKLIFLEQVVAKLRQVEALAGQGQSVAEAVHAAGISEQSGYHWRGEYGVLGLGQAKR